MVGDETAGRNNAKAIIKRVPYVRFKGRGRDLFSLYPFCKYMTIEYRNNQINHSSRRIPQTVLRMSPARYAVNTYLDLISPQYFNLTAMFFCIFIVSDTNTQNTSGIFRFLTKCTFKVQSIFFLFYLLDRFFCRMTDL